MLNLILAAALVGATITFAALWRYGLSIALIGAPFGASLLALVVALIKAAMRSHRHSSTSDSVSASGGSSQESQIDK
jgi:hypothetical protein